MKNVQQFTCMKGIWCFNQLYRSMANLYRVYLKPIVYVQIWQIFSYMYKCL